MASSPLIIKEKGVCLQGLVHMLLQLASLAIIFVIQFLVWTFELKIYAKIMGRSGL